MWVPPRLVLSWSQLTQALMSRTARQIWLLMAFSMLLVWLYSYNTVNPTEPYVKRSHSSTTGAESVVVIFTNRHNDNGNDTVNELSRPTDRRDTPPSASASASEGGTSTTRDAVQVKDMPFSSEKQFDVNKHVFRRLDSPVPSPSDEEKIPAGILQMVMENGEGIRDISGPASRPGQKGPVQMSASAANASRADAQGGGGLKTQPKPPSQLPSNRNSEGRHVPDWVLSLFFSGDAAHGDPAAAMPPLDAYNEDDMADIVFTDLTDLDERQRAKTSEKGVVHTALPKDEATELDLLEDLTGPLYPSTIQRGKQLTFQSPVRNKAGDADISKQPQESAESPVQLPDLDFFPSAEPVHWMKQKDLTGKLPARMHTNDGSKPEPAVHNSLLPAAHENKKAKKIIHKSAANDLLLTHSDDPPQPTFPLSGDPQNADYGSEQVADKDLGLDAFHGLKQTPEKPNHIASAASKKSSDAFPGGPPDRHSDPKIQSHQLDLNLTLWKNVLKERKRLLRAKCQDNYFKQNIQDTHALVDHKKNLLYCPVAKTGSGFFHRFFFSLKHSNRSVKELPSPFDVSRSTAMAEEFDTVSRLHRKGFEEFMANSLKFVVVREPFSRLFAAYVDSLLVPDSVYWRQWGIPAISKHRKYPSSKSLDCGHDVTFAEFVKYVIDTLHDSDDTVKPVSTLCAPCDLRFSVIGHVETLVSDIEYILSLLKLSIGNFSAETFMNDVNDDIISDSTIRAFEFYEHLKSCISKYEMGKRLWRNLQIHGIISEELTFSFAPKKVDKLTPLEFVKIVQEARRILPDSERVQQQKFKALKAAFENISAEDIMQLVKIYALDFEFFGYDRHPSFLS